MKSWDNWDKDSHIGEGCCYLAMRCYHSKHPYSIVMHYGHRNQWEWVPEFGWRNLPRDFVDTAEAIGLCRKRSSSVEDIFDFVLSESKVLGLVAEMEEYLESIPGRGYADYLIRKHVLHE